MLSLMGAATAAAIGAAIAVPGVMRWAERRRIVSVPNARSSHTRVTPLGGGLPIVAVAILGTLWWGYATPLPEPWLAGYLAGAIAIAAISWVDDLWGVPPLARLAVHITAAVMLLLSVPDQFGPSALARSIFAIFWIVWLTNAYNFMDGVDGIAGSQAIVAGAGWAWMGYHGGDPVSAGIGASIAGACLGFLVHNWQPARVFMGDVGSAFLGYTLGALTVIAGTAAAEYFVAGALFVWPFLFDTGFTLLRRIGRRENILQAHRSHLYQRLVGAGWTHAGVSLLYAALAVIGVALAEMWVSGIPYAAAAAIGGLAISCAALWLMTARAERAATLAPSEPL